MIHEPAFSFALARLHDAVKVYVGGDGQRPVLQGGEPWFVDGIWVEGAHAVVHGWALPRVRWTGLDLPVPRWNGRRFDEVRYVRRDDIGARMWQRVGASFSYFQCRTHFDRSLWRDDGYAQISLENPATSLPDGHRRDWWLLDPKLERAIPDAELVQRALGVHDELLFRIGGATAYRRLAAVAEQLGRRQFADFESVLDLGVGCGRLARYAARDLCHEAQFIGTDIDAQSIDWCRSNLGGTYLQISARPPTNLPAGSFDLIFGVSVFSRMSERLQDEWLGEVHRLLRPGGIALITVRGRAAIEYAGMSKIGNREMRRALGASGILRVRKRDPRQPRASADPETYHSTHYVRRRWSRYLRVEQVLPAYVSTDDLVCLRRD